MVRLQTVQRLPWRTILAASAQWGVVAALGVMVIVFATQESGAPAVVKNLAALSNSAAADAYSLSSLHRRLPPAALSEVQRYLDFFITKQRRRVEDGLARSGRYREAYKQIFRSEGIPEELVYLPMIESGFMEKAVSPARAVGVWQFIEETGRMYNLHHDDWFDRRLDPINSAKAAAQLLSHLHDLFDDWDLALAAYNSGAGTVKWALRVNTKAGLPTHFWALDLPDETRNYVPAFIAMMLIAKNPSAFGFSDIQFHPKLVYDQIKVAPGVSLEDLGASMGVEVDQLLELNPELIKGAIPPGKPYTLRIPTGTRSRLMVRLGIQAPKSDYFVYPVTKTDTLDLVASQFQTRLDNLQRVNQIKDDGDLLGRRCLIIPL